MKATPTGYKGHHFRSKSEAIFARNLDIGGWIWEYEPRHWMASDCWTPDFWAVKQGPKHTVISACIEYKPAEVTPDYANLLARRFNELRVALNNTWQVLAIGNAFDKAVPRKVLVLKDEGWVSESISLLRYLDEAKEYRFDLA